MSIWADAHKKAVHRKVHRFCLSLSFLRFFQLRLTFDRPGGRLGLVKVSAYPPGDIPFILMIVCDKDKLDGKRCNGAPDFIIEIVSPSNLADDYIRKLYYYKNAGVREYWIVDPRRKIVTVNYFQGDILNIQYSFESTIKVNIYADLYINFSEIAESLNV